MSEAAREGPGVKAAEQGVKPAGWVGDLLDLVPFGKYVKTWLKLPGGAQRIIVALLIVLAIYPLFVVFGVVTAIRVLPDKPRAAVASYLRNAIGSRADGVDAVNQSNKVIDGSVLMNFALDANHAPDGSHDPGEPYYIVVNRDQAVDFLTYEQHGPGRSNDLNCINAEPRDGGKLGALTLAIPGTEFSREIPITSSFHGTVVHETGLGDADWAKIQDDGSKQVELAVTFQPDAAFTNSASAKCFPITAFVNMMFKKPALR